MTKKLFRTIPLFLTLLSLSFLSFSQDLPDPMDPPRLVNDFASFLSANEVQGLESKLRTFNNETTTQIYVVIIPDLKGYDPGDYATRLGEKWGIGQKGKNNGIVILVKPKTAESKGEVFISTGYGLEGVVPDAVANQIVDNEIIPAFKNGTYAAGLNQGVDILMSITRGEFTAEQYSESASNNSSGGSGIFGIIILIIIISMIFGGKSRTGRHQGVGGNLPFWLLLGMMNSGGRSHGGSFGDFSGGSGGFGGFGGGGGGSFGGGGAGGSW